MIDSAITHLAGQLNHYLRRTFALNEDIVVVSNLLDQNGNVASHISNKLVLFLINIEKDTGPFRQPRGVHPGAENSPAGHPPIFLNLYVMVAGHFGGQNYPEALKFISNTISFFQRRPVFDHQNSPDLDQKIDRLVLEIENLNIKDLSSLWGVLSGKYLPSVLYKIRMVTFDSDDIVKQVPTFKAPQTLVSN